MLSFKGYDEWPFIRVVPHDMHLPPDVIAHVDRIWSEQKAKSGNSLFNGRFFSLLPGRLDEGFFTDYKFWLAQRINPSLQATMSLRPLAVTGLVRCADGILFGRRSAEVQQASGYWELIPSGGVDEAAFIKEENRVDPLRQFYAELQEETGLSPDRISSIYPLGVLEDHDEHVVDIVISAKTGVTRQEILQYFKDIKDNEHKEVAIIGDDEMRYFIDGNSSFLLETTLRILEEEGSQESQERRGGI